MTTIHQIFLDNEDSKLFVLNDGTLVQVFKGPRPPGAQDVVVIGDAQNIPKITPVDSTDVPIPWVAFRARMPHEFTLPGDDDAGKQQQGS